MCDAISIGLATLASGAVSAYGQYQSGKDNARIANANAKIQDAAASDAINRGNQESSQVRDRARQVASSQIAAMSANGVDLSSGSVLDLVGDTATGGKLDSLTTITNSMREAYGYRQQAQNSRNEAKLSRRSGNFGAASTLLTSALSGYGAYNMMNVPSTSGAGRKALKRT